MMSLHVYPILEQNEVEMQFASKYSGYSDLPYLMWQKEYGTIQKYRAWEREKKKTTHNPTKELIYLYDHLNSLAL